MDNHLRREKSADLLPADGSARCGDHHARSRVPKSSESLDALFDGQLKLFQSRRGYRFSLDTLVLAYFTTLRRRDRVIDLGTGNGVIPLILSRLHPAATITGVEYQSAMVERAARNVKLNQLDARIFICRGDVRVADAIGAAGSFDVVVCNPPYRRRASGRISPNDEKQIARHEIHGELGDFLAAGAYLLRVKGRIALVYLASRAVDLLSSMRQARLEPKRLRMVHSFKDGEASLILVEGVKHGRSGVEILPPLIVYREGKEYSDEVAAMIAGKV
ncbi:MAG TPA: tRNA1(Val) (adenine(37)-N6)-methyltransferase [Candidatus Limnocylindrales bacterium]|nr:tRNA1(Val) (adenine(37)-N6)-methyltransferase [Candidatus Limnocylindrales bacterium]